MVGAHCVCTWSTTPNLVSFSFCTPSPLCNVKQGKFASKHTPKALARTNLLLAWKQLAKPTCAAQAAGCRNNAVGHTIGALWRATEWAVNQDTDKKPNSIQHWEGVWAKNQWHLTPGVTTSSLYPDIKEMCASCKKNSLLRVLMFKGDCGSGNLCTHTVTAMLVYIYEQTSAWMHRQSKTPLDKWQQ